MVEVCDIGEVVAFYIECIVLPLVGKAGIYYAVRLVALDFSGCAGERSHTVLEPVEEAEGKVRNNIHIRTGHKLVPQILQGVHALDAGRLAGFLVDVAVGQIHSLEIEDAGVELRSPGCLEQDSGGLYLSEIHGLPDGFFAVFGTADPVYEVGHPVAENAGGRCNRR